MGAKRSFFIDACHKPSLALDDESLLFDDGPLTEKSLDSSSSVIKDIKLWVESGLTLITPGKCFLPGDIVVNSF